MSQKIVAYFSASGVTADAAKKIAGATDAALFEIRPATPYTAADLDWRDETSRSTLEMKDKASRPAIAEEKLDLAGIDTIFLGFPIWWYTAPTIVNTFLEQYDFSGKKVILFATSGSTDFGSALADLSKSVSDATCLVEGIVVHGKKDDKAWKNWVESLDASGRGRE